MLLQALLSGLRMHKLPASSCACGGCHVAWARLLVLQLLAVHQGHDQPDLVHEGQLRRAPAGLQKCPHMTLWQEP